MRQSLIVGNWKMNGSRAANAKLMDDFFSCVNQSDESVSGVRSAVCVPFVYLDQVGRLVTVGSDSSCALKLGAQDVSLHVEGAYTGEISAMMLADMECSYVIVGHSERREYHHESNFLVGQKALAALQAKLTPIVCVGETLEQREKNSTLAVIEEQLMAVKSIIGEKNLSNVVVAYEPVWAIGTGLTASPEQAQEVHQFMRAQLGADSDKITLLYGGSVKPENAAELFRCSDIDGALVGGASLDAQSFSDIISAASI
jgi:triosephosphate isomerase (TIM)